MLVQLLQKGNKRNNDQMDQNCSLVVDVCTESAHENWTRNGDNTANRFMVQDDFETKLSIETMAVNQLNRSTFTSICSKMNKNDVWRV